MAFDTYETSAEDAAPVELYAFTANGSTYRYTSADEPIVYGGHTYAVEPLQREAIEDTTEIAKAELRLTCALDFPVAALFTPYPPSDVVTLSVRRMHRGDTEAALFWVGRVLTVTWEMATARITCESALTSLRRPGLRRAYQRTCPHIVYGTACGVNASSFDSSATISSVDANELVSSDFSTLGSGYLAGGYLQATIDGIVHKRAIRTHVDDTITVSHPLPGLEASDVVTVFAGCDRTISTCLAKFANAASFGGFPHIPRKNPFDRSSVFY